MFIKSNSNAQCLDAEANSSSIQRVAVDQPPMLSEYEFQDDTRSLFYNSISCMNQNILPHMCEQESSY